jgi:hypothetical protein
MFAMSCPLPFLRFKANIPFPFQGQFSGIQIVPVSVWFLAQLPEQQSTLAPHA